MKVNEPPKIYGTETVMLSDKPATAISDVGILQAAEKIKKDMYVDDIVTGDKDVESTESLKKSIEEILLKGGFKVKGFVMSGELSVDSQALLGTGEVGRILGIGWKPYEDEFVVRARVNISKKFKGARKEADMLYSEIPILAANKLTRRILLGITNSCYDPLGLVSPITVQLTDN